MTRTQELQFLAERAESLAIVHLTRRPDLSVWLTVPESSRRGLDLRVALNEPGKPPGWRSFGVALKGARAAGTLRRINLKVKTVLHRFFDKYGEPSIPCCLFYFTMENDRGYFAWIAEPLVEDCRSRLKYHRESAECAPLNLVSLDEILKAVDAYYEAFFREATRA